MYDKICYALHLTKIINYPTFKSSSRYSSSLEIGSYDDVHYLSESIRKVGAYDQ